MVKLVYCIARRSDISPDEFQRYWLEEHAPLVSKLADALGAVRYVQSHTVETGLNDALRESRGAGPGYDGITEVWWESLEALAEGTASATGREAARALLEDERRFIEFEKSSLFVTEEHPIFDR